MASNTPTVTIGGKTLEQAKKEIGKLPSVPITVGGKTPEQAIKEISGKSPSEVSKILQEKTQQTQQNITKLRSGGGGSSSGSQGVTPTPETQVTSQQEIQAKVQAVTGGPTLSYLLPSGQQQLYSSTYGKVYMTPEQLNNLFQGNQTSGQGTVVNQQNPAYWHGMSRFNTTTGEGEVVLPSGLTVKYDKSTEDKRVLFVNQDDKNYRPNNYNPEKDLIVYTDNRGRATGETNIGNIEGLKGVSGSSEVKNALKQTLVDVHNQKVDILARSGYTGGEIMKGVWDKTVQDNLNKAVEKATQLKIQRAEEFKETIPGKVLTTITPTANVLMTNLAETVSQNVARDYSIGTFIREKVTGEEYPDITAKQFEPIVRKATAKEIEVVGSVGASALGITGTFLAAPSFGASVALVGAGGALKSSTGYLAEVMREGEGIDYEKTWENMEKDFLTGGLQAMPYLKPGTRISGFKDLINIGTFVYGTMEKINAPLFEAGISQEINKASQEYENKQIQEAGKTTNILNQGASLVKGGVVGGLGRMFFSSTEEEMTRDLALGTILGVAPRALGPLSGIVKPVQNVILYGIAPVTGVKGLTEAKKPSDVFISTVSLLPALGLTSDIAKNELSNLRMDEAVPGLNRNDVKGVRVTADLEFDVGGNIKHLIYNKQSGTSETPGGGFEGTKESISLKDVLNTAVREIREETGIKLRPEQLKLVDIANSPIETQFVVTLKNPLPSEQIPTKLTKEAMKEKIENYQLIDNIGSYFSNLKTNPSYSPIYTSNTVISTIGKVLEFPGMAQLRQQDISALKRVEEIKKYDLLSNKVKAELEIKGQEYFKKNFPNFKQDVIFPVNIGREFYLIKQGLGSKELRQILPEFKVPVTEGKEIEVYKAWYGDKVIAERVKSFEIKDIKTWGDFLLGKQPGTFKKGTGKEVLSTINLKYNDLGLLDKLTLQETGVRFFQQILNPKEFSNLVKTNVDLGLRYYSLTQGYGNKIELSRLKQLNEKQTSPFDISKMEVIQYKSGREVGVSRDELGRFQKMISQYQVNPEMSMTFIPHSRYRGTPSEIAKFLNDRYFAGSSLSSSQIKTVGELVKSGMAQKLNLDTTGISEDSIVVLSKDQKKVLTGQSPRGENVMYFTPPTRAGITGETVGALSYAGIGGLVDYEMGFSVTGTKPVGYITESKIKKTIRENEFGFTKRGSPILAGKAGVSEIEVGLKPGSVLESTGREAKVRVGGQTLTLKEQVLSSQKLLNTNLKVNVLMDKIDQLYSILNSGNLKPNEEVKVQNKLKEYIREVNKLNNGVSRKILQEEVVKSPVQTGPLKFIQPEMFDKVIQKSEEDIVKSMYKPTIGYPYFKEITPRELIRTIPEYRVEEKEGFITTSYKPITYSPGYKSTTQQSYKEEYKQEKIRDNFDKIQKETMKMAMSVSSGIIPSTPRKTEDGYYVYVKLVKSTKFGKLTQTPVSKSRALDIGTYYVDNTVARTFKRVKANAPAQGDTFFDVPSGYYNMRGTILRGYRIKKGVKYGVEEQFIQRSSTLLQSNLEKEQLKMYRELSRNNK